MSMQLGLPYAPEYYERNSFNITATADGFKLIDRNSARVYLHISAFNLAVPAHSFFDLEQVGGGGVQFHTLVNQDFELWWHRHKILVNCAVFCRSFGYPQEFNVTEVTYNLLPQLERENATRDKATLTTKIKDFIFQRQRFRS